MTGAERPWPPLISAQRVPWAVKWRDVLLTLLAWGGLAVLLDHEFALFLGGLKGALGLGAPKVRLSWLTYLERLMPFLITAAALGAALLFFSLATLRRRSLALLMREPPQLAAAVQARAAGLDEAALILARNQRIVVVRDGDGRLMIEAKPPAKIHGAEDS